MSKSNNFYQLITFFISFRDWERKKQNVRLVKSIKEIQRRQSNFVDILDKKRIDGQNIYYLVGHSRGNIFTNSAGTYQEGKAYVKNPVAQEFGTRVVPAPDKNATRLRTIPNSNLTQRKTDVLRIHKENLKFVSRLSEMKAV